MITNDFSAAGKNLPATPAKPPKNPTKALRETMAYILLTGAV